VIIISVAARRLGLHANTLRKYERQGLIAPSRSPGNLRLFTEPDLTRLEQIKRLVEDRRINLTGVKVALEVTDRVVALRQTLQDGHVPAEQDLRQAIDDILVCLLAAPDPVRPPGRTPADTPSEDTHERRLSAARTRAPRRPPRGRDGEAAPRRSSRPPRA
jgi:DNA-binding transcriptional MerR regulator